MTYPACSHGRGIFKKIIFATRSLLAGHSSTLESLVNAFDLCPTCPSPQPLSTRREALPPPGAAGQRLCPRPFPPSTRREALPRLPGRLGGRLSTLLRGRHFQENILRYPLPARPPPSPGAAGQRLCPRPFPPSTRREALPRLPGRLGGRLSTLLRGRHFPENILRYPLPARPPPSPGAAGQRLCPRPFPPSTRREGPPSTPRTPWWPPQHALTGPALSRKHSSLPVACSATPFPWSRWSASLPPPIPPFHPTRSPPSTPRTSWWPPQHALTGPALSRKHSSLPVCLLGHPLPLEPLVSISAPAHSPLPPDEKPSLDSQDVLVAASARSYGAGTFKKTFFATRCLLGHPLPLEPLVSISASAPSPSPPVHTLLLRRSGSLDLGLRL